MSISTRRTNVGDLTVCTDNWTCYTGSSFLFVTGITIVGTYSRFLVTLGHLTVSVADALAFQAPSTISTVMTLRRRGATATTARAFIASTAFIYCMLTITSRASPCAAKRFVTCTLTTKAAVLTTTTPKSSPTVRATYTGGTLVTIGWTLITLTAAQIVPCGASTGTTSSFKTSSGTMSA